MQQSTEAIHREEISGWLLAYVLLGEHTYAVEIGTRGDVRCRLTVSRAGHMQAALDILRTKALAWIADYESRTHTGDTGFGDLN